MSWLDKVGWPKVVLVLGLVGGVFALVIVWPESFDRLWTAVEDLLHHGMDLIGGE